MTGKVGKINKSANAKLSKMFSSMGITYCEKCGSTWALSFAHRHKRLWYRSRPELLSDYNQVLLLCVPCHQEVEYDKDATEKLFEKLRGGKV